MTPTLDALQEALDQVRRERDAALAREAKLQGALADNRERETATAEILRAISASPGELEGVLAAIGTAAMRLCVADHAAVVITALGGERRGWDPIRGFRLIEAPASILPWRAGADDAGRGTDAFSGPIASWAVAYPAAAKIARDDGVAEAAFVRAQVASGAGTRVSLIVRRNYARAFEPEHISLLERFADQALIAIENARVFNELQQCNRDVSAALELQSAIAEVLGIIAGAPAELDNVLPQLAAAAEKLCEAEFVMVAHGSSDTRRVWRSDVGHLTLAGHPSVGPDDRMPGGVAFATNRSVRIAGPIDVIAEAYPRAAAQIRTRGASAWSALAVPLPGPGGPVGSIVVSRDSATPFTDRHVSILETFADQAVIAIENARLFNQLQAKTQELEIASRHKSEFLANMSHELRTPLNAIIGYAELLQEECEDLGQNNFLPDLGKIHAAGKHLLTLISGILDLSKVEAGRMTMFLEDFEVATLVREAVAIVRPMVEKNGNRFEIDCPADIGLMHADVVKIRQVLFNLLSNAAKFTRDGTISLRVYRDGQFNNTNFAVRDTGIGITEEQLARLFEAFSQASAETNRKYGGTGLGLALSRQFCVMMGGDITVQTSPGQGSVFTATLPSIVQEAAADAPQSASVRH